MFYLTFAHHAFDRSSHNNVDTPAFSGMEIKEMLLMERADRVPYPWGARLTELEVKTTPLPADVFVPWPWPGSVTAYADPEVLADEDTQVAPPAAAFIAPRAWHLGAPMSDSASRAAAREFLKATVHFELSKVTVNLNFRYSFNI